MPLREALFATVLATSPDGHASPQQFSAPEGQPKPPAVQVSIDLTQAGKWGDKGKNIESNASCLLVKGTGIIVELLGFDSQGQRWKETYNEGLHILPGDMDKYGQPKRADHAKLMKAEWPLQNGKPITGTVTLFEDAQDGQCAGGTLTLQNHGRNFKAVVDQGTGSSRDLERQLIKQRRYR